MIKLAIGLICLLLPISAFAADLTATLQWDAPATGPVPTNYKIYMCDNPILDNKTCGGNMQVFVTKHLIKTVVYQHPTDEATVFYRVSSILGTFESELSGQVSKQFVRPLPSPLQPPTDLTILQP